MRGCARDPAAVKASILSALLVLTSTGPLDLCRSAVSCRGGWGLVPLDDSTAVRYDQFGITPLFTTFGVRCEATFFVTFFRHVFSSPLYSLTPKTRMMSTLGTYGLIG